MLSMKSCFVYSTFELVFRLTMNLDVEVHRDDIEIIKHEIHSPASAISLEEIDRIIDPRSATKHDCVMNRVNEIDVASERCTRKRPAYLDKDRICSHYVMHYMKRYVCIDQMCTL